LDFPVYLKHGFGILIYQKNPRLYLIVKNSFQEEKKIKIPIGEKIS
jgi:hypothetical protein